MKSYLLDKLRANLTDEINQRLATSHEFEINPANPKTGAHFAIPLFSLAKELGKDPSELAQQLEKETFPHPVEKSQATGGFLNLWLDPKLIAQELELEEGENYKYGELPWINEGKVAVCDYPSPNIAKPLSVGHLRVMVQGAAMDKLLQTVGFKTISDDHYGDTGRPFGLWVVGFKRYGSEEGLKKRGIYELSECYIKISADLKNEEQTDESILGDEIQRWIQRFEAGDSEAIKYQEKFTKASLEHLHNIYSRLGIKTDIALPESYYVKRGHELTDVLVEKGLAKPSEGAIIVDLDDYGITTPLMLRKSNGTSLYAATDLATMEYRDNELNVDEVFIHTGEEQNFYFRQLEALRQKTGYKGKINHLWHGLVNQANEDGSISKMSSRKGVVYLEDLLNTAENIAREQTKGRDVHEEDINKIALGAIKFNDFAQDRKTNILFDWDRMFSLQGFSGPFVQYAGVRIKSILTKFEETEDYNTLLNKTDPLKNYDFKKESSLLLMLVQYPEVVKKAAEKYEPHHLAAYAFELAKELNRYYEEVNIINSENTEKAARIWLLKLVYQVLESSLGILGIEIPSKM